MEDSPRSWFAKINLVFYFEREGGGEGGDLQLETGSDSPDLLQDSVLKLGANSHCSGSSLVWEMN